MVEENGGSSMKKLLMIALAVMVVAMMVSGCKRCRKRCGSGDSSGEE